LRARRQLSFPQHRWWRRLRASGTKSFLQLTHLRRPNGFIAHHHRPYRRPQQTDLSRSEERFRREVNPPTRSKYFYLESGRISTDPLVTFIPPEEDSFHTAAHTGSMEAAKSSFIDSGSKTPFGSSGR
jgi:hypothetical protein